jgi:hypothetical protein
MRALGTSHMVNMSGSPSEHDSAERLRDEFDPSHGSEMISDAVQIAGPDIRDLAVIGNRGTAAIL